MIQPSNMLDESSQSAADSPVCHHNPTGPEDIQCDQFFRWLLQLNCLQGSLGRNFAGQRYGPRPLDLDIIFYGNQTLNHDRLCIPHPRWQERPFVKAPLLDLVNKHEVPMDQATAYNAAR